MLSCTPSARGKLAIGPALLALLLAWSAAPAQEATDAYRLASGDRVRVTVFGHDDLSGEFEVSVTGNISLPLIREVEAEGLTVAELEAAVAEALQPDYLRDPRVSVEMLNYRPFYIVGEVNAPGSYPYVNGMTVLNAVAVAGGYTFRARKNRVVIVRGPAEDQERLETGPQAEILPGDVIEIPERFF